MLTTSQYGWGQPWTSTRLLIRGRGNPTVANYSLYIPNNHLIVPSYTVPGGIYLPAGHRLEQLHICGAGRYTLQQWSQQFFLNTREMSRLQTVFISFHRQAGLVEIFCRSSCASSQTCLGRKREARIRRGDTLCSGVVRESEILTSWTYVELRRLTFTTLIRVVLVLVLLQRSL